MLPKENRLKNTKEIEGVFSGGNKVKRILRDVVQRELPRIAVGFDAVVVVQKAADRDLKGAAESMRALIYKAKLLN